MSFNYFSRKCKIIFLNVHIPFSLFIICLCLQSITLFTSCTNRSDISTQNIEKISGADEIIHNMTMVSTIGETREWLMTATYFERFNSEKRWVAYNVFLETLNEVDKNFYRSDSVFVSEITDVFTGMGNVEIISPNGILHTDKIIWDRKTDRIHAPNDIYIINNQNEIWGNYLFTNSNLDFVDLRHVSGIGSVE